MNIEFKNRFLDLWAKYFGQSELPIVFFYSDDKAGAEFLERPKGRSCIICELAKVRNGRSMAFNAENIVCGGGKRFLGFEKNMRPGFEYFLSCGNENMEGERYLRTPEIAKKVIENQKVTPAIGKNIVFKRWDHIADADEPEAVIFFAKPDVLSGLFTLANFDQTEPNGTITPFGSGCAAIVHYPLLESKSENPRAVIGMFDPSARPCVPANVLSFAVPVKRFEKMVGYMEESFLITETWTTIQKRMNNSQGY